MFCREKNRPVEKKEKEKKKLRWMTPGKPPLTQPQLIWRGCHRSSIKGQRAQSNQGPAESSQPESTGRINKEVERELPFWGVKTKREVDDGRRKKKESPSDWKNPQGAQINEEENLSRLECDFHANYSIWPLVVTWSHKIWISHLL